MKKITLVFIYFSILHFSSLHSQVLSYSRISPLSLTPSIIADFEGVIRGANAFADIENDGDLDLVIMGLSRDPNVAVTNLYKNDGSGNFSLVEGTIFDASENGEISFNDIDNDGDQDLMIVGGGASKLYLNDGEGVFSVAPGADFMGLVYSKFAFSDVDNDGDTDVLLTGANISNAGSFCYTKLYKNDGLANFTEVVGVPFQPVYFADIAFNDVDLDGDKDVLIIGQNFSNSYSNLYLNDGFGDFILDNQSLFQEVNYGSVAFSDVDNDGDSDVLISGCSGSEMYLNDGAGVFTLLNGTSFQGIYEGDVEFNDVDNDGDFDLLTTGNTCSGNEFPKLYLNDGSANFTLANIAAFDNLYIWESAIAFGDIDSDGDSDCLIIGGNNGNGFSKLLVNDGFGDFKETHASDLIDYRDSSISFSDVDNDGDNDILITGEGGVTAYNSDLYINNGNGNFVQMIGVPFIEVNNGATAFADIENDGDEDVLIIGNSGNGKISTLYKNNGLGQFVQVNGTPFYGVELGNVKFADFDNDYDMDVFISGYSSFNQHIAYWYENDGLGNYSIILNNPFTQISPIIRSSSLGDINNDGDLDVLISSSGNGGELLKYYENDGSGGFTIANGLSVNNLGFGKADLGDIDGDDDLDVVFIGTDNSKVFLNDGSGDFVTANGVNLLTVTSSSISLIDADMDGDLDLMINGHNTNTLTESVANLYINNGMGDFQLLTDMPFIGTQSGAFGFSNLDGDNQLDLVITGFNYSYGPKTRLYSGDVCTLSQNDVLTFVHPSDANNCLGALTMNISGNPDFTCSIDGGPSFTHSGYHLEQNLCVGVHDLSTTDGCGNTVNTTFIIPVDTNYVFNNPFIDSIAVDSLGATIENCDIYYNSIDTAFIDSIWANGNTVTVIWNIVDSNGSNSDTSVYVLNNGNGVYYLQLSVFCPTKALGEYFTVTEAIYFNDGSVSTASVPGIEEVWFAIHPNPTNDQVFVHFDGQQAQLRITDALGKLIYTNEINSGSAISLLNNPSGVYFFQLTSEKGSVVKRVVKN
jgi:Secretion system C-terminal sorting domain/FG-GAP-like repeat